MRDRLRSLTRRLPDLAIPVGVGTFYVLVALDPVQEHADGVPLLSLVAAVIAGGALHFRRRRPERVVALALLTGLWVQIVSPEVVVPFAGLFAVGSLAAVRPPRVSLVGLVALEALAAMNLLTATREDTVFAMALGVGAWALGEASRSRRIAIHEGVRRAVGEEQARIARELHDVLAHSVAVIVVQAAAADDVFDERPAEARAALRSIEEAGREALQELRLLLDGVRPGASVDTHLPQPGLDRLEELAGALRAGGLQVRVRCEGQAPPLPAGVELSAYRIVQEALTNTLRHAEATSAEVTVRYGPDAVELDVRDDGRGGQSGDSRGGGQGLIGMRERAALLGGTLEAGPLQRGGYRVHASLPVTAVR